MISTKSAVIVAAIVTGVMPLAAYGNDHRVATSAAQTTPVTSATTVAPNVAYKLAGTIGLQSDPFWISMMCGGTKAAEDAGSTIEWKSVSEMTPDKDQVNVDAINLLKPDGVALSQISTQHESERKAWMDSGVPVVVPNSPSDDDNFLQAFTAAPETEAIKAFGSKIASDIGETGTVAIFGGVPGVPFLDNFWKPVVAELKQAHPDLNVLPTEYDSFDVNKTTQIASGLIVAHPDLKAIYAISGPEGTGVVAAVKQAGLAGQINVYSGGGDPVLVDALNAGAVKALLAQSPYQAGNKAVHALIDYLNAHGKAAGPVQKATTRLVYAPTMVLTKDNIASPEAKDFIYLTSCG